MERMAGSKTFGALSISIPSSLLLSVRLLGDGVEFIRVRGEWPPPHPPLPCWAGHANNDLGERRVDDVAGYDNPVAEFFQGRRGSTVRARDGDFAADAVGLRFDGRIRGVGIVYFG